MCCLPFSLTDKRETGRQRELLLIGSLVHTPVSPRDVPKPNPGAKTVHVSLVVDRALMTEALSPVCRELH